MSKEQVFQLDEETNWLIANISEMESEEQISESLNRIEELQESYANRRMSWAIHNSRITNPSIDRHADVLGYREAVSKFMEHAITSSMSMKRLRLRAIRRSKSEYNHEYLQLVAGLVITDDYGNVLTLLTNDKNRIKNKHTIIQGHVDARRHHVFGTLLGAIEETISMERDEEVSLGKYINDLEPYAWKETDTEINGIDYNYTSVTVNGEFLFIYDTKTSAGIEHIGFIKHMRIKNHNLEKLVNIGEISSNEPHKHDVRATPVESIKNGVEADSWLSNIVHFIP